MDAGIRGIAAIEPSDVPTTFEVFFRSEFSRLAGYLHRMIRDEHLAADLAQEALVRTQARWVTVREPRPYAYLVATNLARRHLRSAARQEQVAQRVGAQTQAIQDGPDLAVRDAVSRLPRRLSEVVALHYWADLPIAEVARVMDKPEGTIKRRLHEARTQLAQTLRELP